jgi:ADP-L-glycero-D-manno-heptose 6-epimerase
MIAITGAAGFIGSCLVGKCNEQGREDLVVVDDFSIEIKNKNLQHKKFIEKIDRKEFINWFKSNSEKIEWVLHIGARTDTTEFNYAVLEELNLNYSKSIWQICTENHIPLIYASSAATYGAGEYGYDDNHDLCEKLKPLNPYGISKNEFDKFVLQQTNTPPYWYGLKFFNVYGPNEFHKGRMASVIFHAFNQFRETGKVKLFKSHRNDFEDGMQLRDFIYVKDVLEVIKWLMNHKPNSGIYNVGTGTARAFYDLVSATAAAMQIDLNIDWIDIPEDIRDKYQYFTEANMAKLKNAGYQDPFYTLEDGVKDYVQNYLLPGKYY